MRIIKYQLCTEINHGTEDTPDIEQVLADVTLGWTESNEQLAQREAYNGVYTIEDDGEPEPSPSQIDRIEAQCTYTAMITDTLMTED